MTTTKKSNVLGGALAGLSPAAPAAPAKQPAAPQITQDEDDNRPIGVLFRLSPRDHEVVSDYARDRGWSVQELLEHAVNRMRESEGLSAIEGRPRSKTRRRRLAIP
jgi:hypothetical protein